MTELSDELLVAYVDGQLARDQSKAVERVLEQDEVAAQRVEAMRAAHTRLEAAFDAMLADELAAMTGIADDPVPERRQSAFGLLRRGGAIAFIGGAVCLLMAGAVGGYALRAIPDPSGLTPQARVPVVTGASTARDWQDDVIITHTLFGRDTFSVGLESQANIDLVRFHLGNLVGAEIQIPDLGTRGLTFKRAQVLERQGEVIVQIAYLPLKGEPVALYTRWDEGADTPIALSRSDGMAAAQWRQENLTTLLVGDMPDAAMEKLAGYAREQIAANNSLSSELETPLSAAEARATAVDPMPAEIAGETVPDTDQPATLAGDQ